MSAQLPPTPSHVPESVVYDFDYANAIFGKSQPHLTVGRQLKQSAGDIFYTPRNGGHWTVQSADLATDMLRREEIFSTDPQYNENRRFSMKLLPIQVDGADHVEYRKVLGAYFAPGNMKKLEGSIRAIVTDLIDQVEARGGCEFVTEFGELFPISVFLRLVDAPLADRLDLLPYAAMFTRSWDVETRSKGLQGLANYVSKILEARRHDPGSDILSQFIKSDFHGRPLTEEELQSLGTFMFLAGLDTVKSAISFTVLYLAQNPEQYARLVEDPGLIPAAVEELLRFSGVSITERGVTQDIEIAGVTIKKGERVIFLLPLMGFDEKTNSKPFQMSFDREVSQHLNFGAGPHRCAGSHLARIEIRVLLEEWTRRFPTFRLDPSRQIRMAAGPVWAPAEVSVLCQGRNRTA